MKSTLSKIYPFYILAILALILNACSRDLSEDAELATFPKNGEVFIDGFSSGLEYLPFGDSFFEAFSVDEETFQSGTASMRFDIPSEGNPDGAYAGAIFPDNGGRDLSDFDALTFYAKSSVASTLNEVGFGQDFAENKYLVTVNNLPLSTNWVKFTIPIPDPSKLTQEKGLFWYAEGPEEGKGFTIWFDEVQFETLGTIGQPRAVIADGTDQSIATFIGENIQMTGLLFTANLANGRDQTSSIASAYYEFTSSNESVATVNEMGFITAVGEGNATITASLNGVPAQGSYNLNVTGSFNSAPNPTQDAQDVVSIFSDSYENEPVDYYNGFWAPYQTTMGGATNIGGDNILSYSDFNFVGIQSAENVSTIDISEMTHFHVDIQPREDIQPGDFMRFTLLDAGSDATVGTSDDSTLDIVVDGNNLTNSEWYGFDIPFSSLPTINRRNLAQIIMVTDATISEVFLDNLYFYKGEGGGNPTGPQEAAPQPTADAADVIAVFSDAYPVVDGTNLNPDWGQATQVSETPIEGNNTLVYRGLNYQGIELGSTIDVSGMEFLHIDYWTENSAQFNAFIISNGPVETAYALSVPTSGWGSVDIPLGDFAPVDLADVFQMKFDGNGDIYLDNIYFYRDGGGGGGNDTEPTVAAPVPTQDAGDVISIYSDAYDDVPGTNFNPDWGQATQVSDFSVAGDNVLLYAGLNYQGTELASSIDVSGMEFLHIDYWTANSSNLLTFLISNGPVETSSSMPVPTNGWGSVDIPLGDFNPVDLMDVFQMKFEGDGDIYLDNIYFYRNGGGGGGDITPLSIDFEDGSNPMIPFDNGAFGNVVSNPDMNGNNSMNVYEFNKIEGSAWYSGIVYDETLSATPIIDLANGAVFKVKIWSPKSGINIRFQLEGGMAPAMEINQTLDTANEWVEMTFDFTGMVNTDDTYPKFSFFPDFDPAVQDPVSEAAIYYFDDFQQQ